jgi:hypothetical protein
VTCPTQSKYTRMVNRAALRTVKVFRTITSG